MADPRARHPRDKGGAWFVDTKCIACDVARLVAPGLIAEDAAGLSYFTREPRTSEEQLMAWRALLACPTASIAAPAGLKPPEDAFPYEVAPGAFLLGYNSRHSFGANAWFVPRPDGNLMVDSPRWSPPLVAALEKRGGLKRILLTHRDDVADYFRYKRHFNAQVWIHEEEADAAPEADVKFRDEREVQPGVRAIPVPGHTEGSVAYLVDDRLLFTGDTLEWARDKQDLDAWEAYTWYSWDHLRRSLEALARHRFEWVLPGHGGWGRAPPDDMRRRLLALVERMAKDA